jgi:hypothetical protein
MPEKQGILSCAAGDCGHRISEPERESLPPDGLYTDAFGEAPMSRDRTAAALSRQEVRRATDCLRHAFNLGYWASPGGEVFLPSGQPARLFPGNTGGRYLYFSVPGARSAVSVHRFIAYQLFGEAALAAPCVRHRDDNGRNNRFDNILAGTKGDNRLDMPSGVRQEIARRGAEKYRKLTPTQVGDVRRLLASGCSLGSIGRRFGVSAKTVSGIRDGVTYPGVAEACR